MIWLKIERNGYRLANQAQAPRAAYANERAAEERAPNGSARPCHMPFVDLMPALETVQAKCKDHFVWYRRSRPITTQRPSRAAPPF